MHVGPAASADIMPKRPRPASVRRGGAEQQLKRMKARVVCGMALSASGARILPYLCIWYCDDETIKWAAVLARASGSPLGTAFTAVRIAVFIASIMVPCKSCKFMASTIVPRSLSLPAMAAYALRSICVLLEKTGENITFSISFTRARLLAEVKIWNSGPESGDAGGGLKSAARTL